MILDMSVCGSAYYRCANGQCIDYPARCNGFLDCIDETDESDCGSFLNHALQLSQISKSLNN